MSTTFETKLTASAARQLVVAVVGNDALESLVQAMLDQEVPPAFLARIGGPVADVLSPIREAITEHYRSLAPEEQRKIANLFPPTGYHRDLGMALTEFATHGAYFSLPHSIYRPQVDPASRVFVALPDLLSLVDERGLLRVNGMRVTRETVFVDGFALSFHQLLRRGFASNVNDTLMSALLEGVESGQITDLRVAIDERRLRLERDHQSWFEKDYWSGPPLRETRLDELNGTFPQVTVHGRPVGADAPPWDPYDRFAVRWSLGPNPGEKTMEAEELVDEASASGVDLVLVRFAHAIRVTGSQAFRHLDGAVRAYAPEKYARRRGMQFATAGDGLNAYYRKVFRADGMMDAATWSDIIARWFRSNELALEYLSGLARDPS
jgi:hypothetical protein